MQNMTVSSKKNRHNKDYSWTPLFGKYPATIQHHRLRSISAPCRIYVFSYTPVFIGPDVGSVEQEKVTLLTHAILLLPKVK